MQELLFYRIPFQRPFKRIGDIAQVANGGTAMAGLDIADRPGTFANGIQEVLIVIVAEIDMLFIRPDDFIFQCRRCGLQLVPLNIDLSFRTDEPYGMGPAKVLMSDGDAIGITVWARRTRWSVTERRWQAMGSGWRMRGLSTGYG